MSKFLKLVVNFFCMPDVTELILGKQIFEM